MIATPRVKPNDTTQTLPTQAMAMATTMDNKVVMMVVHKVVVAEMVVVVVAMVDVVLVVTETIKDVVGPPPALTLNSGMACHGRSGKPPRKHAIVPAVPTTKHEWCS